jgi:hypothetical protein
MTEQEIVDKAYETKIQELCSVLYNTLLIIQDVTEREQAERRFQDGVRKAREVRDRAKELLP